MSISCSQSCCSRTMQGASLLPEDPRAGPRRPALPWLAVEADYEDESRMWRWELDRLNTLPAGPAREWAKAARMVARGAQKRLTAMRSLCTALVALRDGCGKGRAGAERSVRRAREGLLKAAGLESVREEAKKAVEEERRKREEKEREREAKRAEKEKEEEMKRKEKVRGCPGMLREDG